MKKEGLFILILLGIFLFNFGFASAAPNYFISSWNTSKVAGNSNVTLPMTGNFSVDWGDGNISGNATYHNYSSAGIYTILINGTINSFSFNNGGDKLKIINITQWGDLKLGNAGGYFYGCLNLNLSGVSDVLNLTGTTIFFNMFRDAGNITTIANIGFWNTSQINTMANMFYGATNFNQNLSNWDTSQITTMANMFYGATNFNGNISNWNTSKVTTLAFMFNGATNFNQNLSNWDTSNVTAMAGIFNGATNFNGNISNWNTSKVTDMNSMFRNDVAFNQSIGNWNTRQVTSMNQMFQSAANFNQNISNWDISNVTLMSYMFYGATNFNGNISNWNTSKVTTMLGMFQSATNFNQNLGNWNVSNVSDMTTMFFGATLSTPNYDALLVGWASNIEKNGTTFSGGNSKYSVCGGNTSREILRIVYNWTITDGGVNSTYSCPDPTYPIFSNYQDNNATLDGEGAGLFNVTLENTNGTVYLHINGQMIRATLLTSNIYNVNYTFNTPGNYLYNWTAYGNGTNKNLNLSENRYYYVNISSDLIYPIFLNYSANNATLNNSGIATFNVSIANTNGTVWLEINNVNITATNLTSNVYNVSYNLSSSGSYNYRWYAYGDGTKNHRNNSLLRTYVVNTIIRPQKGSSGYIGDESLVSFPSSALYSSSVNFRPGNNEIVNVNPPRFSWPYGPDPSDPLYQYCSNGITCPKWAPYEFAFQISDSSNFSTLLLNIRTASNSYNFIPPLNGNPNRTYYWRVGYFKPKNVTNSTTWTLQPDSWELIPSVWSSTRQFTLAVNATIWDRSMLANETYLSDKGAHPYILFNTQNSAAVYDYIKNNSDWTAAKTAAEITINKSWWPNSSPTDEWVGNWISRIGNVIFVAKMGQNAALGTADRNLSDRIMASQPQNALALYAQYYIDHNGTVVDTITQQEFGSGTQYLADSYDWLYNNLTIEQRQLMLHAMELRSQCAINSYFYFWNTNKQYGGCDSTGQYENPSFRVMRQSLFVDGHSHTIDNFYASLNVAYACYKDSPICRRFFDLGMNYIIGVSQPFNPESGIAEGKGYGSGKLFWGTGNSLYSHMVASTIFPEARFDLNPFWTNAADAWDRFIPVGQVQGHDPFSDSGWGDLSNMIENNPWGKYLSYFTESGSVYTHWQNQLSLDIYKNSKGADSFGSIPLSYYFHAPVAVNTTPLNKLYAYDGYAFACSLPSSSVGCFNDGVGFTFQARPRGTTLGEGHNPFSDLSFEIWAYGNTITEGGAQGIDQNYGSHPLQRNSLFVNGLGPVTQSNQPFYSRIIAYKSTSNYTYVAADSTQAFPVKSPGYYWTYTPSYEHISPPYTQNTLPFLQKVQRHMLFVKNKYFVIFDDFATNQTNGSIFSWTYPVLENTIISNFSNGSFYYTSNTKKYLNDVTPIVLQNRVDKNNFTNVTVYIKHIVDPSSINITDLTGNKVVSNPITGEDFYAQQVVYDSNMRAHTIWVSNKVPQNSFHFMTVIYPQKPGMAAPIIERIDDYTAKVTNDDGTIDILSFNSSTSGQNNATILVDLSQLNPLPVSDDVSNNTITSVYYVAPQNWSVVDFSYPQFSNYSNNNATLTNFGIGLFNVTLANTNGTVWLEINNANITATSLTGNVYNVSYNFTHGGSYNYRWHAYGNGTNNNFNSSDLRSYLVYTDLTGPIINIISPLAESYRNNVTLFQIATNENTSWCGYSLNGNANVTLNKINGSYFNYSTTLADDLYSLVFSCKDSYNNFASASLSFAIDTLPPSISLNSPLTGTYFNSSLVSFNYTPIGGNGLSTCLLWGNWTGGWAMNKSNSTLIDDNSSRIFSVNLSSGTYKWNVWCNSSLGSSDFSAQGNQTFTVDLVSPNATTLLPLNATLTNQTSTNFTLNASDNFGLVNATLYIVNSTNDIMNQTTLSYGAGIVQTTVGIVVTLVDGVYNWFWNVFDLAGNMVSTQNSEGNKTLTVDLTNPSVNIVSPVSDYYNNPTILVNLSVSDIRNDKIWFNYNGTDVIYTNPITINFSLGSNTLYVYANDSAGNGASGSVSFNVDTTSPVVTVITRQNKVSQNREIDLYYNVSDNTPLANCSLYVDDVLNQVDSPVNRNFIQEFYLANLEKGNYNYSILCFDSAGNYNSSENRNFMVFKAINFEGDTTDLDNVTLSNITNLILEKPLYGKINFTRNLNFSNGFDFDNHVEISFNKIFVNSSALPELNVSAILKFYDLNFTVPKILKDGSVCSDCNIENYSSGILTFNVSGFSEYTSAEQCSDGIKNGDETSVDCGGSCSACSVSNPANGGGGSGGSSGFWIVTYPSLSDSQFSVNGYSRELIVKSRIGFKIANETHYVGIIGVNNTSKAATINVSSNPQQKTMNGGDEWKINVNGDNYYDLIVKLNSVSSTKANITITKINEIISVTSPVANSSIATNETLATPATPETFEENSSSWLVYCLVGLIIFLIIVGIVYLRAKLLERKIRKSIRYYDKK